MALQLNGSWVNSFGSKMDLTVLPGGLILGDYSSTTGASGTYLVIGSCLPQDPTADSGQNLVLAIFWRPVDAQTYNASWHWMSSYCGQLQADGSMTVVNSLVATVEYAGAIPGDYIGELTFTRTSSVAASPRFTLPDVPAESSATTEATINGQWNTAAGDVRLNLQVVDDQLGLLYGSLNWQQQRISLWGFVDTYVSDSQLQSVAVCGYASASTAAVALSGSLNPQSSQLNLSRWLATSTSPANAWLQANVASWLLSKTN